MKIHSREAPTVENAKDAVRATSYSGLLGLASRVPVYSSSLPGALGRYSFKVIKDRNGKVVSVEDRKIELDTGKHSNAAELGATLAHELKHTDDEISGVSGFFEESETPRMEERANSVDRQVIRELLDQGRVA